MMKLYMPGNCYMKIFIITKRCIYDYVQVHGKLRVYSFIVFVAFYIRNIRNERENLLRRIFRVYSSSLFCILKDLL